MTRIADNLPSAVEAHREGRLDEAAEGYEKILAADPGHADALHLLGLIAQSRQDWARARALIERALAARDDPLFWNNLGVLHHQRGRFAAAEAAYRRSLAAGESADAYRNLGHILRASGRGMEPQTEAFLRRALALKPDDADVQFNLGVILLAQGRYREGWPLYEGRHRFADPARLAPPGPDCRPWRGEPLTGKSVLLHREQGAGDCIQFIRYAPLLKAMGAARVTLVCSPDMTALLGAAPGVDAVVDTTEATAPHDYWCALMSLPLWCATTVETIPATLPYLWAEPSRVKTWRDRLSGPGLKVGLVWKGSPDNGIDASRSLPSLDTLAPVMTVPCVTFYSLQKGQGEDEAAAWTARGLIPLGPGIGDFADTAAIIAGLNLIISVDTAVAHLAGALGRPCWVLLPEFCPDWRWFLERSDSPWYPGVMRLFRQSKRGDWSGVVQEVATALAAITPG